MAREQGFYARKKLSGYVSDERILTKLKVKLKFNVIHKIKNVKDMLVYLCNEMRLIHYNQLKQITKDSDFQYNIEFINETTLIWFYFKLKNIKNIKIIDNIDITSIFKRDVWLYRNIGIFNPCVFKRPNNKAGPIDVISRFKYVISGCD